MLIQNIPEIFVEKPEKKTDFLIYDYKMTNDIVKSKVKLDLNMFSFLQVGKKQVHFSDTSVGVNDTQSLLIKNGNCLWTELLDKDQIYFCKLFFFSQSQLKNFLDRFLDSSQEFDETQKGIKPYFVIENDIYVKAYVESLSLILKMNPRETEGLIKTKFEEIMHYLFFKYGKEFLEFAYSLVENEYKSPFKRIVENNIYSNLSLEEISFLCNMSLSTFKRHFIQEFNETPGKWMQRKRLNKAREILQKGELKPSEVFSDFGYSNLSNFSIAFKKQFGISPKEIGL